MIVPGVAIVMVCVAGCQKPATVYDTSSPEAMAESMRQMVANGEPQRLIELIEAPTPELQPMVTQLGELLAAADSLRATLEERMPDEIASLRGRTADAGFDEYVSALFQGAGQQGFGGLGALTGGAGMPTPRGGLSRERVRDLSVMLLADTFRPLREKPEDLGVVQINDDLAALTWAGRPIFPPFGVTARRTDEGWRIVLPIEGPAFGRFMPATPEEGEVLAGLIEVMQNAVADVERDVAEGRVTRVEGLSARATEKLVFPAGMTLLAYARMKDLDLGGIGP